jgi:hypothetical protein
MIRERKIIREDRSAHSKPPTQQPPPSSGGSTASPSELAGRVEKETAMTLKKVAWRKSIESSAKIAQLIPTL